MRRDWLDTATISLAIVATALLLALAMVSGLSISAGERLLFPELARKAAAEADLARRKVDAALELGIPADGLVGVDALFTAMRASDPDIAFLGILDGNGRVVFAEGRNAVTLAATLTAPAVAGRAQAGLAETQSLRGGHLVTRLPLRWGSLVLGHDQGALTRPLLDNLFDIAIMVLVAALLAFEIVLVVLATNLSAPARAAARVLREVAGGRFGATAGYSGADALGALIEGLDTCVAAIAHRLGLPPPRALRTPPLAGARLLAFLFVFAEELARPVLPAYVTALARDFPALGATLGSGIAVGLHMAVAALAMPLAAIAYPRLGRRRLFTAGALIASAGLAGTGLAAGYLDLLLWRALSAVGYATTFIACQGFVLEATNRDNRARGSAMMVGGITLADICGPAIGGIVAERLGHSAPLLLGAGAALAAAVAVRWLMGRASDHAEAPARVTWRAFADTLGDRAFAVQLLLAAVPAKLLLTGFLFYLVPIALWHLGRGEGDTGRVVMLYGLAMLVCGPLFARLADRWRRHHRVVAGGGLLSAAAIAALPLVPAGAEFPALIAAVCGFGVGQSMSIASQVAVVVARAPADAVARGQAPALTVLRFVERLGGGFGPLLAAGLYGALGPAWAIGVLGLYGMASFALYALLLPPAPEAPP